MSQFESVSARTVAPANSATTYSRTRSFDYPKHHPVLRQEHALIPPAQPLRIERTEVVQTVPVQPIVHIDKTEFVKNTYVAHPVRVEKPEYFRNIRIQHPLHFVDVVKQVVIQKSEHVTQKDVTQTVQVNRPVDRTYTPIYNLNVYPELPRRPNDYVNINEDNPPPVDKIENPIEPPWRLLPWENAPDSRQTVKIGASRTDEVAKGSMLDFFV